MILPSNLEYGEDRDFGWDLRIEPDAVDPTLLNLIRQFNPHDPGVSDDKLKEVLFTICRTCPVISTCIPQFKKSKFLISVAKIEGTMTSTDVCALGKDGGAFIPDRFFR